MAAMDASQATHNRLNSNLRVPLETLDYETLARHRDELLSRGFFAIFKRPYREAISFCNNLFPDISRSRRLEFLSELCEASSCRARL